MSFILRNCKRGQNSTRFKRKRTTQPHTHKNKPRAPSIILPSETVAREVQHHVEQRARMAHRQHKAVPVQPPVAVTNRFFRQNIPELRSQVSQADLAPREGNTAQKPHARQGFTDVANSKSAHDPAAAANIGKYFQACSHLLKHIKGGAHILPCDHLCKLQNAEPKFA